MMTKTTLVLTLAAVAAGASVAWVDSRPHWDDTGVTATAILMTSALFGASEPRKPWLWALAVGSWAPAVAIVRSGNYGALLALVFVFVGAYIGAGLRRAFAPPAAQTGDHP